MTLYLRTLIIIVFFRRRNVTCIVSFICSVDGYLNHVIFCSTITVELINVKIEKGFKAGQTCFLCFAYKCDKLGNAADIFC